MTTEGGESGENRPSTRRIPAAEHEIMQTGKQTGGRDAQLTAELLHVFADRDRRRLLLYLIEGNPENRDEIPEHIRVAEHFDEGERRALTEMLRTEHLPLLEENGLIEWDRESDVIVRGERFDEIRPLLTLIAENREELPDGWL